MLTMVCKHNRPICQECGLWQKCTPEELAEFGKRKNRKRILVLEGKSVVQAPSMPVIRPRPSRVCKHRLEQVGFVDCVCQGKRDAYRCSKLIRPNVAPPEQAFCIEVLPARRVAILAMDAKTKIATLAYDELVECTRCDLFEPIEPKPEKQNG